MRNGIVPFYRKEMKMVSVVIVDIQITYAKCCIIGYFNGSGGKLADFNKTIMSRLSDN
jgi:hypothetical protein